jgi:hypothetical protein
MAGRADELNVPSPEYTSGTKAQPVRGILSSRDRFSLTRGQDVIEADAMNLSG